MKWLYERGKIGDTLNVFDITVVLLVMCMITYYSFLGPDLLPSEPHAINDMRKATGDEQREGSQVIVEDVQLVFSDLEPQVAQRIKAGLKDTSHPETHAEITKVIAVDKAFNIVKFGKKKLLVKVPGEKYVVRVQMRITGIRKGETFYYKSQPFVRGKSYTFVTPEMTLVGKILRLDDTFVMQFIPLKKHLRFRARSRLVDRNLAEMVKAGDTGLPLHYIHQRVLKVEIRKILSNHPKNISVGSGKQASDPSLRQLELILECVCAYDDKKGYHYGNQRVRMGDTFRFKSILYTLPLIVKNIEVLPSKVLPSGRISEERNDQGNIGKGRGRTRSHRK